MDRKNVLFVTAEMADFVKTGGLGDVAAALPRALRPWCDTRVLIPGYTQVLSKGQWTVVARVPAHAALPACKVAQHIRPDGLIVYAIVCPQLFEQGGGPYERIGGEAWTDLHIRFGLLSRVAAYLSDVPLPGFAVDVIHANDWHSALTPAFLRFPRRTVLTIHNLAYQGVFPLQCLDELGLAFDSTLECWGQLSFMKAGICLSDIINTVSPHYAEQITTDAYGCGLQHLLRQRTAEGAVVGILNGVSGIDAETDTYISHRFTSGSLDKKALNRTYLQKHMNLRTSAAPVFSVVSRLVHQKGIDLTCDVASQIVNAGGQVVFIGQGEPQLENKVKRLTSKHPHSIGSFIGFEEGLARQMMAASDFLLMPSRFEPCGLSQMYAQKFGCLPIAHSTGGLKDTIADGHTGFLFNQPTADSLRHTVVKALGAFRDKERLQSMQRSAMHKEMGWDLSASRYTQLYA